MVCLGQRMPETLLFEIFFSIFHLVIHFVCVCVLVSVCVCVENPLPDLYWSEWSS